MAIGEGMGIDQHLNQQLCFCGHLSLHHNRQAQSGQKYKMCHKLPSFQIRLVSLEKILYFFVCLASLGMFRFIRDFCLITSKLLTRMNGKQ